MTKDPVCGMEVDEATAEWTSDHMGKTYYFCAPGCKKAFDKDPMKYMEGEEQHGDQGSHEGHAHH